ncbi:DUF86 domain-containing protein [Paenisporosarcina cavernae]|uniref:DUF86 domain-containing protein n=1 Tax=Paenisporosarcina cavernae TaxID=2320858 RepID=A0A385YWA7_9BACL|nr:DUF86 domain-containing protein [Paenisporosarcina cavernae]AYC29968.1 DUF86 domain-containing protein [Paenisporosarcina cavernae]
MYFIDRNKITETLTYLEKLTALSKEKSDWTTNELDKLSLERIVQSSIESMIDVGNSIIDGFIMRDPGSYEDILDILLDENVIETEDQQQLVEVFSMRKELVRNFVKVDHQQLQDLWQKHLQAVERFSPAVSTYLKNELGPVSAFLPEKES